MKNNSKNNNIKTKTISEMTEDERDFILRQYADYPDMDSVFKIDESLTILSIGGCGKKLLHKIYEQKWFLKEFLSHNDLSRLGLLLILNFCTPHNYSFQHKPKFSRYSFHVHLSMENYIAYILQKYQSEAYLGTFLNYSHI